VKRELMLVALVLTLGSALPALAEARGSMLVGGRGGMPSSRARFFLWFPIPSASLAVVTAALV